MKKNKSIIVLLFLVFVFPFKVDALQPYEIETRQECPIIELAEAKEDGSLVKIECYENYQSAKSIMDTTQNDNLVLIEKGMIIDSKYAVIDYDVDLSKSSYGYINVYISKDSNSTNGYYINGGTPDEAAMIEVDYNTKRVKIKVAGLTGWINKYDGSLKLYDIVPLAWVKTPQSYVVANNKLIHNFPGNVYGTKGISSLTIDRKPNMLNDGTYYSYDGNYFYQDMKTLLNDYKNGNYEQSINKDNPYYNYYQYLSFRSKSSYSTENINQYLSMRISDSTSKMLNTGDYFIKVQNDYGVNAVLMMAIGMNESGKGTSAIAREKNNLFGLNAIDLTPGQSANYFPSVEDCIYTYGYSWLSYGYLQPGDTRFKGANLGNKSQGLNYKYASDPFWAEKAAAYYYDIDSVFGFQDYNTHQLAVLNNDYNGTVYAKKTPGGENVASKYYEYKIKNSSILVLAEVEGPEINGNKIWYRIQSDPTLDINQNYIGDSKSNPRVIYDSNISIAYVPAVYFTKINQAIITDNGNNETPNNPSDGKIEDNNPIPEPTPTPPPAKQISAIVTEANYKYGNGNIYGITPGTSIETLKNNLINTGGTVTITDINGNQKDTGNIGTGDKVNVTSGTTETLSVLIYGDTNGDGIIDKLDASSVLRQYYGYDKYESIYEKALDVNQDGTVDKLDASSILRSYYGYDNIKQ